jgi:hypothetical protein
MSVFTTQGYKFRLVAGSGSYADRTQLDLFADEEIKVSNNITDLFDIGSVPGTFTRTITLPGTKKNNRFFEQYYDISVVEPDLFSTNQKVEAYLDFDGIYLASGYLQLQKVSVLENKFVDSYEVNLFGIVSNFSTDAQTFFLTDLNNLNIYNHTSSLANISASWQGNLFGGDVRYALTDSGTEIYYSLERDFLGIDDAEGALSVQQFKPAIKVKTVWDACFSKLGYTYTSSFFEEPIFDNMYMLLNNNLKYPVYPNIQLERYGQFKVTNVTGSNGNLLLTNNTFRGFPANSVQYDYNGVATLGDTLQINLPKASKLAASINLVFSVTNTGASGSGAPSFFLEYVDANTSTVINGQTLANINTYLSTLYQSRTTTVTETFELPADFEIPFMPRDTPINIRIKYIAQGVNNFSVRLNPVGARTGCGLTVKALKQGADFEILNVPFNMPYGTNGIKILEFIRGIQRKFNLVMYEDKQVPNQFKIETFNTWYKQGEYKNFNQYINLDEKIEFIPATSLAVNKLNFTDTQDTDFVSTIWQRTYNRTFGQAVLIDSGSYFSQGEFNVKTTLASGPLTLIPGSVFTGSAATGLGTCTSYNLTNTDSRDGEDVTYSYTACDGTAISSRVLTPGRSVSFCARTDAYEVTTGNYSIAIEGDCSPSSPAIFSGSQFPVYIPYYIAGTPSEPARVLPRLFFYNEQLPATKYYIQGYVTDTGSAPSYEYFDYPYFDNYSVVPGSTLPTTGSLSLLFNNETPSLGTTPSENLISTYWETYLQLLYNPRTRLVNAAAVIPLADYFNMELNDVVQFRSNYYHLRAINDYNLTTGQCSVQLLGPVIADAVSNVVFGTATPVIIPPEPPGLNGDFNCDWNNDFFITGSIC